MKHTKSIVRMAAFALAILVLTLAMAASVEANPGSVIDFEGLTAGDFVSSVSSGSGISGDAVSGWVSVLGLNSAPECSGQNPAMIFDATCGGGTEYDCTGDDPDLFQPGQGNVLIVSEDCDPTDPDDKIGGTLEFDFSAWGSGIVTVESLVVLDTEESGAIELFSGGATGNLLWTVPMPTLPDGGITTVPVGVSGVDFMRVRFYGSGATDDIRVVAEREGEGCSPGYFKNHLDAWGPTGYSAGDDFDATFGTDLFDPDITLEEAINAKGGGDNKLARHGTAALLSAAHPDVAYPLTVLEVIALVQAGDADTLARFNELGCPLN